jgi:hypothetical protein
MPYRWPHAPLKRDLWSTCRRMRQRDLPYLSHSRYGETLRAHPFHPRLFDGNVREGLACEENTASDAFGVTRQAAAFGKELTRARR